MSGKDLKDVQRDINDENAGQLEVKTAGSGPGGKGSSKAG
jgi:hypothetical protein